MLADYRAADPQVTVQYACDRHVAMVLCCDCLRFTPPDISPLILSEQTFIAQLFLLALSWSPGTKCGVM